MKKFFAVFFILLLAVSVAFSVATRRSFTDYSNDENVQNRAVLNYISTGIPGKDVDESDDFQPSVEHLLDAQLIAEVEPGGKAKWEYEACLDTLKIKKVYKGDAKPGELIDCYNKAFFDEFNGKWIFGNVYHFMPMQEGKTYIIFADKKDYHPAYEQTLERKVYVMKCDDVSFFGTDMTEPPVLSKKKEYLYKDVKYYEFICYSEKQRDGINQFKKDVIRELAKLEK